MRFLSRRDLINSKRVYLNRVLLPGSISYFDLSVEAVLLNGIRQNLLVLG